MLHAIRDRRRDSSELCRAVGARSHTSAMAAMPSPAASAMLAAPVRGASTRARPATSAAPTTRARRGAKGGRVDAGRDSAAAGRRIRTMRSMTRPAVMAVKITPSMGAPRQNWNTDMVASVTTQSTTLAGQAGAEARGGAAVRVTPSA
nr:hypothetical protein [Microcella alkalica]